MNFKKISLFVLLTIFCFRPTKLMAQEEEDYSQYEDVEVTGKPTKNYCTSKIVGISPSKLISVGYDFQSANTLSAGSYANFGSQETEIQYNSGLRLMANVPVISNVKWLVSVGANYAETKYKFSPETVPINPLVKTLSANGLTTMGINTTVFKPLNEKTFILAQTSLDWNGDYGLLEIPNSDQLKVSAALLIGRKKHERLMIGYGITRTYRGGQRLYVPVLLYNYTFVNRKWGIECLLPARGAIRYTVNSRNMLFAGFELEGNSYRLNNMMEDSPSLPPYKALELRRSEIRTRLTYEFSVYKFLWLSVQTGYRINYKFNMDDGEFYGRKQPFISENKLGNPFYMMVSLNLVSP